jgi:hypothetical protein
MGKHIATGAMPADTPQPFADAASAAHQAVDVRHPAMWLSVGPLPRANATL